MGNVIQLNNNISKIKSIKDRLKSLDFSKVPNFKQLYDYIFDIKYIHDEIDKILNIILNEDDDEISKNYLFSVNEIPSINLETCEPETMYVSSLNTYIDVTNCIKPEGKTLIEKFPAIEVSNAILDIMTSYINSFDINDDYNDMVKPISIEVASYNEYLLIPLYVFKIIIVINDEDILTHIKDTLKNAIEEGEE